MPCLSSPSEITTISIVELFILTGTCDGSSEYLPCQLLHGSGMEGLTMFEFFAAGKSVRYGLFFVHFVAKSLFGRKCHPFDAASHFFVCLDIVREIQDDSGTLLRRVLVTWSCS